MSARRAGEVDRERWLELRAALMPGVPLQEHDAAIGRVLAGGARRAAFLFASNREGAASASGLVEIARDADTGSVARIEALYVVPGARRGGVARTLLDTAGNWAASGGCTELRCNWTLTDDDAHAALRALGFAERAREVQFSRPVHAAMALAGESPEPARDPATRPPVRQAAPARSRRTLLHGLVLVAGIASLLMTDIFSGDVVRGALLPLLDVVFAVYLLAMIAGRQYQRRTDSNERGARLFDAAPPAGGRDRME